MKKTNPSGSGSGAQILSPLRSTTTMTSKKRPGEFFIVPDSFPRGFLGVSSSKMSSITRASQEKPDVRCHKRRVRFADLPNDKLPAEALSSSFVTSETNQPPKSDDPKTSEYAFFKKLKEDAVHRFHTHSLKQDICGIQLNKFKSTDCSKERSNLMEDGAQDFRPPLLNANVTPEKFISSSLLGNASKKSGFCMDGAGTISDNVQVLENMEERTEYKHKELFSKKRQKLLQWVTEITFPEIDELCSQGYDFISVLLSQLFPQSNEDKSFKPMNTGKVKTNAKFKRSASTNSDFHCKKFHQLPVRNLMEIECGPLLDDDLSSWVEMPRTRELTHPNFLTSYNRTDRRMIDMTCKLGKRRALALGAEGDSMFGFHNGIYDSLPLCHLEELDQADKKSKLLASPKSDIRPNECLQLLEGNVIGLDCGPSLDVEPSSSWLETLRERELTYPNLLTCGHDKTYIGTRTVDIDYEVEERTSTLCTEGNSIFGFLMEDYGSLPLIHPKELDQFEKTYPNINNEVEERTSTSCTEGDSIFGFLMEDYGSLSLTRLRELDQIDKKLRLLAPHESDICFNKSHQLFARDPMEFESGLSLDVDSSPVLWEFPRARELSESNSPTFPYRKPYVDRRVTDLDSDLGERTTPVLCIEDDPTLGFYLENYESLQLSHLKKLDGFHCDGKEPRILLLGCDYGNIADDISLPLSLGADLNMPPLSSYLLDDDQKQNLDNRFFVSGLCSPSLLPFHTPPSLLSVLCSPSINNGNHDLEEHSLHCKDNMVAVSDNFYFPSPCTPKCLNLTDYSSGDIISKDRSIIPSPKNDFVL